MPRFVSISLLCMVLVGCGTLGEGDLEAAARGAHALPGRGADGFATEGDVVLARAHGAPAGASVLPWDDGWLLVHARLTDGCLAVATSPDGLAWEPGESVACPSEDWHGEALRNPTALVRDGRVVVWYGSATGGGMGRLEYRPDTGDVTATRDPVLLPGREGTIRRPHVIAGADGDLILFAEVGRGEGIARALSDDGGRSWRREPAGLLAPACAMEDPGPACERPSPPFDADGLGDPFVRQVVSPLGRTLWDMWYVGWDDGTAALGFAGSFDGLTWSRYPKNPVLPATIRPAAPFVAELPGGTALFLDSADGITLRLR